MVGVSAGGVVTVLYYPRGLPPSWSSTTTLLASILTLWLQASGAKFATIGMLGPLPGKTYAMVRPPVSLHACSFTSTSRGHNLRVEPIVQEESMPDGAHEWFAQSAAFVIVSVPGKRNPFEHYGAAAEARGSPAHSKRGPVVQSTVEVLERNTCIDQETGCGLLCDRNDVRCY